VEIGGVIMGITASSNAIVTESLEKASRNGKNRQEDVQYEAEAEEFEDLIHRGFIGTSARRRVVVRVTQIVILCTVLGLWQYMASGSKTLMLSVGTPWDVMRWIAAWATGGAMPHGRGWADLGLTLEEAAAGYVLGVFIGVIFGSVLGSSRWLRSFSTPFIAVLNAFPKIALAPLFILIIGSSFSMKAYFVAATAGFITFYAVFNGITSIDPVYLRNAKILGAGPLWRIKEVYLPAIVGWVTAGLRLTAAWSISAAVVAEFLAANNGMGYVINLGQQSGQVSQVLGGIAIVAFVALIVDRVLLMISRHFSAWRLA
jgi:NitT/TauT family transport system permease protein